MRTEVDWRNVAARAAVTAGAWVAYTPLLTLDRLYVTDDAFTSDIFNGELPARVLVGQLLASGQAPVWTSKLGSGIPLAVSGTLEPISLALFATLPMAPALCLLVLVFLLIAAHGTYNLARRLGADRYGAVLAGMAYAGSGYLVTQLKHLCIVSTVIWLPWGILMLDRALGAVRAEPIDPDDSVATQPTAVERIRDLGWFGLVFAEQIVSGFPQSAYICALVYGGWAIRNLMGPKGKIGLLPLRVVLGAGFVAAVGLAALCGATSLLPLSELGSISDRHERPSWEFASMLPYSASDALNFFLPYVNGNVADGTYHADGLFWENYGYVGIATISLALWAVIRGNRRKHVGILLIFGALAFSLVLGPRTPIYYYAWKYLPGMGQFRFPTRFLFVVDFALAILGGLGLGLLRRDLARWSQRWSPLAPRLVAVAMVFGTGLDLYVHQTQQNPFVAAREWLQTPHTLRAIASPSDQVRFYSPLHDYFHRIAHVKARGWADLGPYFDLRETLAPNTGVYWGTATVDCYMGVAPRWVVDVWGDHSRWGIVVPSLLRLTHERLTVSAPFVTLLGGYGVTHVTSPVPIVGNGLREVRNQGPMHLYEIGGRRARIVPFARVVRSDRAVAAALLQPEFDPDQEVLLQDSGVGAVADLKDNAGKFAVPGTAHIIRETSQQLLLEVSAPQGGFLLLADTYYPGWHAKVDGVEQPILRANISVRAVKLPAGAQRVEFSYDAAPFWRGLTIAAIGFLLLLCWVLGAARACRSAARSAHA